MKIVTILKGLPASGKSTWAKEQVDANPGKYNILMAIDDRLQVCRLWHELGLPLFRVGDPDADF